MGVVGHNLFRAGHIADERKSSSFTPSLRKSGDKEGMQESRSDLQRKLRSKIRGKRSGHPCSRNVDVASLVLENGLDVDASMLAAIADAKGDTKKMSRNIIGEMAKSHANNKEVPLPPSDTSQDPVDDEGLPPWSELEN